jgi:hypothetical protein
VADHGLSPTEKFQFFLQFVFGLFFRMVSHQLLPEVRIRSFQFCPPSDGASSAGGGHVELCVERISISLDSVGFLFDCVVSGHSLLIYGCYHW